MVAVMDRTEPAAQATARDVLWELILADRRRLGLNHDEYAELHGVSPRTLYRVQRAIGKLPKPLSMALLLRHPEWRAVIDGVVLEDARR